MSRNNKRNGIAIIDGLSKYVISEDGEKTIFYFPKPKWDEICNDITKCDHYQLYVNSEWINFFVKPLYLVHGYYLTVWNN